MKIKEFNVDVEKSTEYSKTKKTPPTKQLMEKSIHPNQLLKQNVTKFQSTKFPIEISPN
jgi:hypothetical protein